jgi:hypothetical protein
MTWYDKTPWLKSTFWNLSEHSYLPAQSFDEQFRWSVQVVRRTGVDAEGRPVGIACSPVSEVWTLRWSKPPVEGPTSQPEPTSTPKPTIPP